MKVNFYTTLRQVVGQKSVEFDLQEGATLKQLLDQMLLQYPALHHVMVDSEGDILAHVHIFVNGHAEPFIGKALETLLNPDDVIRIFPAIEGG
jgi:MoaD family protein